MYHSITFGDKNTWDDWHLIPKTRPLVNPPPAKTHSIDIPGGDGTLDLTEALVGRPVYGNRTGSWEFIAENGFKPWHLLFSEIMSYLHGQSMRAVLEDDPDYYYSGRFTVNGWNSGEQYSTVTIQYDLYPYKMEIADPDSDWLWDNFNFETGVIREYSDRDVDGSLTIMIIGDVMSMPIVITASAPMTVTIGGQTFDLVAGTNRIRGSAIQNCVTPMIFTGNGTVTVVYRGGKL